MRAVQPEICEWFPDVLCTVTEVCAVLLCLQYVEFPNFPCTSYECLLDSCCVAHVYVIHFSRLGLGA